MPSYDFVSKNGKPYSVHMPEPNLGIESKYIFAFAKSGSTLLDNLVRTYCANINVPAFSLYNSAFDQGISTPLIADNSQVCFKSKGYIYTGFRHYPQFTFDFGDCRAIWLVRDPRDMLVSMYYSILKSHVIPEGMTEFEQRRKQIATQSIDDYVLKNRAAYLNQFNKYVSAFKTKQVKVFRYEDVIYRKNEWFKQVLDYLQLGYNASLAEEIVKQFDIIPECENQNEHVRQVHPGNYKAKLNTATIETLNEHFKPFLEYFNYDV